MRDPSSKEVSDAFASISKQLREGKKKMPTENYLLVFLFAGHGILKDGMQCVLYNEYDPET